MAKVNTLSKEEDILDYTYHDVLSVVNKTGVIQMEPSTFILNVLRFPVIQGKKTDRCALSHTYTHCLFPSSVLFFSTSTLYNLFFFHNLMQIPIRTESFI